MLSAASTFVVAVRKRRSAAPRLALHTHPLARRAHCAPPPVATALTLARRAALRRRLRRVRTHPAQLAHTHAMSFGGDGPEPSEGQMKDMQQFLETENQKAVIQQAIAKLTEQCFEKCIGKPGTKLDSSEANCVANCAGRYLDSSVFIVNRMMAKRQQG